jgi:hypothetical protein
VASNRAFYSSCLGSYNESQARQVVSGQVKPYAVGRQWPGVANDVFNNVGTSDLVVCFTALGQQHGVMLQHRCAL